MVLLRIGLRRARISLTSASTYSGIFLFLFANVKNCSTDNRFAEDVNVGRDLSYLYGIIILQPKKYHF